ncbi:MAG: DUF2905 domain-containing protein [Firmicutes bacterium]|nr:DUF2905 domain-containing protein [Bacillota bacterium]
MTEFGRMLMLMGGIIFALGLLMTLAERVPGVGRLPGDILIQRGNFTFYFPIMTSLLLSVVLSLFFWVISRLR